ncbi:RNA transcription, translation and transport factor protein-like [Patiria miniata]|uniref:RNA transcription, translation and transport factor protein n=1 Tax=Patiria miniata TaxID=46514 RepID=A0A913Z7K5_PATMI|nr:RNA transcription, translation and transport factor protein-like [Patiria miniata]
MFRRKLEALGYHQTDIDITDEMNWRNFVIWLEDQKIRMYKIEERQPLRKFISGEWPEIFQQYLKDLHCPLDGQDRLAACEWLLAHAVRLDYGENVDKYKAVTGGALSRQNSSQAGSDDPFENVDVTSPDFNAGLTSVCQLLNIPQHYDRVTTLEAISILIQERLAQDGTDPKTQEGIDFDLNNYELGFETKDPVLDEASRILRLLHVAELRDLQTKINEAIVAVQSITANPRTDQKLGKVGR